MRPNNERTAKLARIPQPNSATIADGKVCPRILADFCGIRKVQSCTEKDTMIKSKAPPQTLDRDWLTVKQTADYLQVNTRTVHRYIALGRLKAAQIMPGGVVRIAATSIEKMLETKESK